MKDLTIIIPTLNGSGNYEWDRKIAYSLRECLISLQETAPDIPIVIASNGNDVKPLPIELNGNWKRIHLWEQGQCRAVNAAVATTNTKYIMVSNDDMIYPPGWLEHLTAEIAIKDQQWNCICPKLVEPIKGAPTFIQQPFGGAGGDFNKAGFLKWVEERYKEHDPGFAYNPGFNLPFLIKREIWDKVGGYDINYDPWGSNSDSDLAYKIRLAGYQPKQQEHSYVYHFSQTSQTQHPENHEHWVKNWEYFKEKWGFERAGSPEIWQADFKIDYKRLKYRPSWADLPQGDFVRATEKPAGA